MTPGETPARVAYEAGWADYAAEREKWASYVGA